MQIMHVRAHTRGIIAGAYMPLTSHFHGGSDVAARLAEHYKEMMATGRTSYWQATAHCAIQEGNNIRGHGLRLVFCSEIELLSV